MYYLDTDIATLILHSHERVLERMAAVDPAEVALTLVTRIEMLRGRIEAVIKASSVDELSRAVTGLAQTDAVIGQFPIVSLAEEVFAQFAPLRANKKLNKMDAGDRLQAAIALAHGATLVTRNTKDYEKVPNLKIENWAE